MKIGISWDAYGNNELRPQEQIELLKSNGFEATFPMSDNPDMETIIPLLNNAGISADTCHAPFKGINGIWSESEDGDHILKMLTDSIDVCSRYEIPIDVVHISSGNNAPRICDAGYKRFSKLVEYADKKGVVLAFENQRKLANIAFIMEEFPSARFCWDAGHEACFAGGREYMPLFGSRLAALHLHDNFGVQEGDEHMIPYDAALDYGKIAQHIANSEFNGTIMLELMRHTSGRYEDFTPEQYYSRAAAAADKIRTDIEKRRS